MSRQFMIPYASAPRYAVAAPRYAGAAAAAAVPRYMPEDFEPRYAGAYYDAEPEYAPRFAGGYAPREEQPYEYGPDPRYGGEGEPMAYGPAPATAYDAARMDRAAGYSGFHLSKRCAVKARTRTGKTVRVPKKSLPAGWRAKRVVCRASKPMARAFKARLKRSGSKSRCGRKTTVAGALCQRAKRAAKRVANLARSPSTKARAAAVAIAAAAAFRARRAARGGGAASPQYEEEQPQAVKRYRYTVGPRGGVLRDGGSGWRSVPAANVPEHVMEQLYAS